MDNFQTISDVVQTVSIIIGIWVAIYGIDSWRREHRGKRQIELAEDTLSLFYEAKDALAYIRSPMSFSSETEEIERGENETEDQFEARKKASIVFVRFNNKSELFNKIHAMRYRFMALIGKEEAEPFINLRKIEDDIFFSARTLVRLWARNHFRTDEQWDKHFEQTQEHEDVIWSYGKDDKILIRIENVIKEIENICEPIIAGEKSLHKFLTKPIK